LRKLTIVFHDGGGGHRNAAEALQGVLTTQQDPWDVRLLNIQELLDQLDLIRNLTGLRIQDTYNQILRRGWTRIALPLLRLLQFVIRLLHGRTVKILREYWLANPTDMVLSVIPHFNREIAESVGELPNVPPFITLITDLADFPPHFWIERESQYIIAGTERAKRQAMEIGLPENKVFLASGMVLKPKFYEPVNVDREAEHKRLGLDADCPTGIVLFGGHGSSAMIEIARELEQVEVQLIMICGHNDKLAAQLKDLRTQKPMLVVGFATNVEYYMALADFFIGKPGPGSISEALQLHLPVIVECNAKTLPQERYNAEWVTEKKVGIVVPSFRDIASAVQNLLEPEAFNQFQRNVSAYSNRALAEVPVILDRMWDENGAAHESEPSQPQSVVDAVDG
jgi:hypothetical protein